MPQKLGSGNAAAVNGLRNAYVQKYVPKAAAIDQAASPGGKVYLSSGQLAIACR